MKTFKEYLEEVKKPTGDLKKACWDGYTAVGMKMKGGRKVPNCVPEEVEQLDEYGNTAKGQKMLTKVQKRAVDRVTSRKADTDPKYAKKNSDTANRAWERMSGVDEEVEPIDEISKELAHSYLKKRYAQTGATRQDKPKGMSRKTHDKQLMGLHRAQRRLTTTLVLPKGTDPSEGGKYTADSVELHGDTLAEVSDATLTSYKEKAKKSADTLHAQGQYKKSTNRWLNVMKATGKQIDKLQKENTLDPKAATEAPCDCANNPDDVAPKDKNKKLIQMSKSARIIKSIYNRKNMKEEVLDETWKYHTYPNNEAARAAVKTHHAYRDESGMASGNPARVMGNGKVAYKGEFKGPKPVKEELYDQEKEGKSVATYGKKPKLSDNEKKIDAVGGKAQAAAIMTGGTTLTGTPRDTVEIDPMMKLKPGLIGQTKK